MAGEGGRGRISRQTVAVILVLCYSVPSSTCFSLRGLSKKVKQDKVVSEATVMEVRTGSILFNGKELNSPSGSASAAATGNDGLLQVESDRSDGTGTLEQTSQLEDAMAKEAAWRRLNPSLHCGQNKMKLKAMGPGAADLELGNTRPLPLIQVPETCGYSMKQNALGLVLVVPYDGCNVIQENGNYVLPMSWLETPVKFTCPMSTSSATTPASTTPKPTQQPWKLPFPRGPWSLNRHKRNTNQHLSIYDPSGLYYYYNYLYYYYMYMMASAPDAAITTAKPATTTMTTKPCTKKHPQTKPPAYPSYPYYPPYFPHPYHPPAGQVLPGTPDNSDVYYYPVIQHLYGKSPYPQIPNQPMQTTRRPTLTTTKPTTASAPTARTKPSSSSYPGPVSPYVPYYQLPFTPYVSYNKAGILPDYQKYMPHAGYKSGLQARAHPHPGFQSWQPAPWFPHSTGQDDPQFA